MAPLASGNGQPSVQNVVRDLRALGYVVNVDDEQIDQISETIRAIAEHEDKPLGEPIEYNGLHFMHQTPGGMLSNFRTQLATAGLADRYDELLHEIARVRSELAYPIMITPFAQFVGTQAVMNVMTGERYKIVPNEIKKYVLGYYGDLLAAIDPELRARRSSTNGASDIALEPREPISPCCLTSLRGIPTKHRPPAACARCSPVPGRRDEEDRRIRRQSRRDPPSAPGAREIAPRNRPYRYPDPERRRPADHASPKETTEDVAEPPDIRELKAIVDWVHLTDDVRELSIKYGEVELFVSRDRHHRQPAPSAPAMRLPQP